MASAGKTRRTLIIVENLPSPFDRRVWQEATTLKEGGYVVTIVCPTGPGYERHFEVIDDIHIYRYRLPFEADGVVGYLIEYVWALLAQFFLAIRVYLTRGFDVIHACNPPDNIFLVALPFKLFGVRFLFDHHDINPELYEAKFGRRGFFYGLMLAFERWTFRCSDVSIATNESYRRIAVRRGGMDPRRVFVVRSGPDLTRLQITMPNRERKHGRRYLVGYVGVMGKQEGIDLLLEAIGYIVGQRGRIDIHFCLVGGGTELGALVALSAKLGVADYVTFTGRVSDADLLDVLNSADICVNPDRANAMNDMSTMNKIMEYMALAKPIVQFDLAEGRFSAQGASLYAKRNDPVDFGDKILELLGDETRRKAMGDLGRSRVQRELAWEFEAPKLIAAYDALFGS